MPNQLHLTVENPEEILNAGAYDAAETARQEIAFFFGDLEIPVRD